MNVCLPIETDRGLQSTVYAHFGSAPRYLIVDSESGSCETIENDQAGCSGMIPCGPLALLARRRVDAMVVSSIGKGAHDRLRAAGIAVHRADHRTVEDLIRALEAGALAPIDSIQSCAGHGHRHGKVRGQCRHRQRRGRGQRHGADRGQGYGRGRRSK